MNIITDVSASIIEVPLKHVFATAQDKLTRNSSSIVQITVTTSDGFIGVGEAVPVKYVTGETPESVMESIQTVVPTLIGNPIQPITDFRNILLQWLPHSPTTRAGIEIALYQLFANQTGKILHEVFGGKAKSVETDYTLSISPDAVDRAREAYGNGFRIFKVKVGSPNIEDDLHRIIEVHRALPACRFRIDANQAFTPDGTLHFIDRVLSAGVRLELVEQPVLKEDLIGLNYVAERSQVPIFADEAIKSPEDARKLVETTAVRGINIKLMKSGIFGALDIISIASRANCDLMIGCMLETRYGISVSHSLACGTNAFRYIDLDSHLLLNENGTNPHFVQNGPIMSVI